MTTAAIAQRRPREDTRQSNHEATVHGEGHLAASLDKAIEALFAGERAALLRTDSPVNDELAALFEIADSLRLRGAATRRLAVEEGTAS